MYVFLSLLTLDQAFSPDRSAVLVAREEQEGNESEDISTTANKSRRRRTRATEQVDTSNEDYSKLSIRERAKFKVAQVRAKMEEKARAKAQAKA